MNNNDMHRNYIKTTIRGKELGDDEKSSYIASIADEFPEELPEFNLIPAGLVLVCVADNKNWAKAKFKGEVAIICETEDVWEQVKQNLQEKNRPVSFFLVKREWVRKMAARELESDYE